MSDKNDIEKRFEDNLKDLVEKIRNLLLIKRKDYGSSFQASCDKFGLMAPVVRLSDKIERLSHLIINGRNPKNESIEDTFMDICGYGILSLLWLRDKREGVR